MRQIRQQKSRISIERALLPVSVFVEPSLPSAPPGTASPARSASGGMFHLPRFGRLLPWILVLLTTVTFATRVRAEITPDEVRDAIQRGVRYLKTQQSVRGGWSERPGQPGGVSALCTLAMLESGEPVDSPAIQKALAYLRSLGEPAATYTTALQTMVFCAADPKQDLLLIRRNAEWLAKAQIVGNERSGAWTYFDRIGPQTRGDNSNSQFALLGLYEAEQAGIEIDQQVWQRALDYWLSCQREDGSWGYYKELEGEPRAASTGSMTCAGIGALVIASGQLHEGDARVVGETVECCGPQQDQSPLERALQWLGTRFSVQVNPGPSLSSRVDFSRSALFYYLYGVERVGRLTGRRFIGRHDWYREGAEMLVQQQDKLSGFWKGVGHAEEEELIATSLALLFLSKGRRPVVMAKLKHGYGNDWDHHRSAVHHLTRDVERLWEQKLSWQTIDIQAATLEDLLETPVLFISGRDGLQLSQEQKMNLKDYVNQGGFLFAEACCGGDKFDQAFRSLMQELFPDSSLRLLPAEHPVWFAQREVNPKYMRPLYGIDACCRTSVVYCPKDLSCLWELHRGPRQSKYPVPVREEIDACLAIGANVLAYATNRQLKDKLQRPRIIGPGQNDQPPARGTLIIPNLQHAGGSTDAANALPNLLRVIESEVDLRLDTEPQLVELSDPQLFDYPIVFLHGRRDFRLSVPQRKALAVYLRRGGFLFGDSICASPEFTAAVRREIKAALPEAEFVRVPFDHPLFRRDFGGKDLPTVTLRDPQLRTGNDPLKAKLTKIKPLLEAVEIDGRLAVVFSPYDISCALENHASLECKGYVPQDAASLGVNIVLFALQQ